MSFSRPQHLGHVARQRAAGGEEIDLEHQRVAVVGLVLQQVLQRGIGDQAAVPVPAAVDLHHRQPRRQRARGHDVFRQQRLLGAVEIAEIAGGDVHRADRQAGVAARLGQQIPVHQLLQRLPQRGGVVEGGGAGGAARREPGVDRVGRKKPGVPRAMVASALCPLRARRRSSPSGAKGQIRRAVMRSQKARRRQPVVRPVAGDERGIHRADRDAGQEVRLQLRLMQRLVDAGLVGAEGAAALQHQGDAAEGARDGIHRGSPGSGRPRGECCARFCRAATTLPSPAAQVGMGGIPRTGRWWIGSQGRNGCANPSGGGAFWASSEEDQP